jgi:hypothetical protein
MEINFKEKEAVEIVTNDKSRKFEVNDIEKIYVTYEYFLLVKVYYLKIITKNGNVFSTPINRKYKSKIKRELNEFKILLNWGRLLNKI